jgi:hypothetical protein
MSQKSETIQDSSPQWAASASSHLDSPPVVAPRAVSPHAVSPQLDWMNCMRGTPKVNPRSSNQITTTSNPAAIAPSNLELLSDSSGVPASQKFQIPRFKFPANLQSPFPNLNFAALRFPKQQSLALTPPLTTEYFLLTAFLPFLITRLILIAVACYAINRIPGARADGWNLPVSSDFLNMWSHFDGRWYFDIAKNGYQLLPNQQCNVAFSPLYPMLMRFGGWFAGGSDEAYLLSGIFISNLSLLIAIGYTMALLLRSGRDRKTAALAAWYILIFPTSFFLSAVYPMSLFMALASAAFYHAQSREWTLVGILAGLAALTRPDGVLLTAGLAVEFLLQFRRVKIHQALPLLCGPLATLGWLGFQYQAFGDPLAFMTVQKQWNSCPLATVLHSSHAVLQLLPPFAFAVLAIMAIWNLRPSLTVFYMLMLGVMLNASRYWSITRFVLVLFPAFMMLALAGRRWRLLHLLYALLALATSVLLMMRFSLNLWVA